MALRRVLLAILLLSFTWELGGTDKHGTGQRPSGRVENPAPPVVVRRASSEIGRTALEAIESTQGGRHWIDAKTDPPKSPKESQACFQIEPGMRIELAAAEPLVMDPVAIAFDEQGRMFVVEFGDYPTGPAKEGDPSLSRIVMLEDTDGDGRMDQRHLFADQLTFANSLMPFKGGMLVGAQTEILFLKDTNGDDKADRREVLFGGFQPAHPQMQIGNPRWGLDNWIYLNYGPGKIRRVDHTRGTNDRRPTTALLEMPRKEFRFHPLTMEFGPASGLGQFGNTIDNFGRRFFCTNRNPIITAPISHQWLQRNPFLVVPRDQYDVAPSGGDSRVYPLVEMKSNYLSHAGTHTAACGTTAYRGDLLGAKIENSVLVCEPIGHLVTRSTIKPDGVTLAAERARPKADFLASTDTWFRPASLATGPDGTLYLADMYRLWVEHPKFLPEEIGKRLDWRAGDDRGRIWRIVPDDRRIKPRPFVPPETTLELVAMLADGNGWRRQLAQRLLVERQAKDAAPRLRELLQDRAVRVDEDSDRALNGSTSQSTDSNDFGYARLHALWTLDGLGVLTEDDASEAMDDPSVHVRRDAAKLSARFLEEKGDASLLERLATLADDEDVRVRFQVALALGATNDPRATELLTKLALRDGDDRWFATAILTSTRERSGAVLAGLVNRVHWAESRSRRSPNNSLLNSHESDYEHIDLVRQLATIVGARGDLDELALVLRTIGRADSSAAGWQNATLSGLAMGLPRHRDALGRVSLAKLLANPPRELAGAVAPIRALLDRTAGVALNVSLPIADRVAAIELLGYQPFEQSAATYEQLMGAGQPVEVQLACIEAMQHGGNDGAAKIVRARWPTLGPRVRPPALDLLLRRTATTRQALEAMAAGKINPAVVDIDRRVLLLRHRDASIKTLAEQLFGGAVSADRREVAQEYTAALTSKASVAEGMKVFDRVCAKCHRIDGRGHEVGPDISDVRNRSREALLHDILDPNQKLEPRFTGYTVLTVDGRHFNGLLVSEAADAIVLRQSEGKEQTIARNDIEEFQASGISVMPEGVEKDINIQQMADLLEYLKAR